MEETSLEDFLDPDGAGAAGDDDGGESDEQTAVAGGGSDEPDEQTAVEGGGGEGSDGSADPVEPGGSGGEAGDSEAVAPQSGLFPTYRFAPAGAVCEACDTAVERRWRDDGRYVCPACKSW